MKRIFDFLAAGFGLVLVSPILLGFMFAIWAYDRHPALYISRRVGKDAVPFRMLKLRSMVVNADRVGGSSTSAQDRRITPVGHLVRRYKLDELVQLWNVVKGDLSLVGPRPNVPSGVAVYTEVEKRLLSVRPGITDLASIVFSDEGEILKDHADADAAYDALIRPWKSELGLLYIDNHSIMLDIRIIWLTVLSIVSKRRALAGVVGILHELNARAELIDVARRDRALVPSMAPGVNAPFAVPLSAANKLHP